MRGLLIGTLVAALAVAGIALGVRVAGPSTHTTALGDVRLRVEPSLRGEVDAYVPIADWGVRANAFRGPFRIEVEPRSIDRSAMLSAAAGEHDLLDRATDDADAAAASVLWRTAGSGVGGAVLAGALASLALRALRSETRRAALMLLLAVTGTALVIVSASVLVARVTFDPQAFEQPRFYARGTELRQLLDSAAAAEETAAKYRSTVEGSLQGFSSLLARGGVGAASFPSATPGRRALLASDLHANRLVVGPLKAFAGEDRPVFLAGDFGHEGNEGEARLIAPALGRLGTRVIAVSGNHDSSLLMRALARAGIIVLTSTGILRPDGGVSDEPVIEVDGMNVAGFSDPLEWRGDDVADPRRVFGFAQMSEGDRAERDARAALVRWFDGLPRRPHIVLVHQNGLAQHLARTLHARGAQPPLVVLTGHDHRQHVDRHGEIVVVDAGSVGAGGLLGVARERVAVAELHFKAQSASLQAVDLIEVAPLSGAAQAERVIVDGRRCDDDATECVLSTQ